MKKCPQKLIVFLREQNKQAPNLQEPGEEFVHSGLCIWMNLKAILIRF